MKAGQQLSENGVEVALFPFPNLRVTQGVNDPYSHNGTLAIDVNIRNFFDIAYAPFSCRVAFIWKAFHAVVFESLSPVLCADGTVSTVVLGMLHDDDISDIKLGQVFKQGEKIYDEGRAGSDGNPKYPVHVHMTVSKRPTTPGKHPFFWNDNGDLELRGEVHPADVLFVNDTNIVNGLGYAWKVFEPKPISEPQPEPIPEPQPEPIDRVIEGPTEEPIEQPIEEPIVEEPTEQPEEPVELPVEPIPSPIDDETEQVDTLPDIPLPKPKPAPNATWWARLIMRIIVWIMSKWGKK